MIIERGDIRLIRLTEEYIELVRQKRNLPEIQKTMEYREYITPEMQKKWFASINNINNYFFLVEINNKFIGLISAADVDWENSIVNNGGIFTWDKRYLQSPEIIQSSVLLQDLAIYMGMGKIYVYIIKDNNSAITFNRPLGYKLLPGQEDLYKQRYEITAEIYLSSTQKIRHQAGISGEIKVFVTQQDCIEHKKIISLIPRDHKDHISFEITG